MVTDTVAHLVANGRRVFVDCEHFFDGYRANPEYAEVVRAAAEAGAEIVVLCDTNGGMLPSWMGDIVSAAAQIGVDLGIHCHSDTGCAVANTLAAVEAGVMHVQGTMNGHGERTGNANIITVVANLQLKFGWELVTPEQLAEATRVSHAISGVTNYPMNTRQPYVGASAFAHKAGLHASAIKVDANLYQHIDPKLVGNDMRMLVSTWPAAPTSDQGLRTVDLSNRDLAAKSPKVKTREMDGYSYESADASFELLVRDELGLLETTSKCSLAGAHGAQVKPEGDSEAVVKVRAKGVTYNLVGEGHGPLNALDVALRNALNPAYPQVDDFELTDYKVRIIDQGHGTDAIVRTLIDMTDGERTWTTVGVGTNRSRHPGRLCDGYLWALAQPAVDAG